MRDATAHEFRCERHQRPLNDSVKNPQQYEPSRKTKQEYALGGVPEPSSFVHEGEIRQVRRETADDKCGEHQLRSPQGQYRGGMSQCERQQLILPDSVVYLNLSSEELLTRRRNGAF